MDVLIFKTNAATYEDFKKIKNFIFSLPNIKECTIDLDDCDKVLRIITDNLNPVYFMDKIKHLGYFCEELPD